MKVSS